MAQSASVVSTEDEARYVEAERACVGAVLGAPSRWDRAMDVLRPFNFSHPPAYVMFDALDNELDFRRSASLRSRRRTGAITYPEMSAYTLADPRVTLAEKRWGVSLLEFGRCIDAAREAGCLDRIQDHPPILSQFAVHNFEEKARTVIDGHLRRELVAAANDIEATIRSDAGLERSPMRTLDSINKRCHSVRDIAERLDAVGSVVRWPQNHILVTQPIFPAADVRPAAAVASFATEIEAEMRRLAELPADSRRSRVDGVSAASSAMRRFQERLESAAAMPGVRQLRERVNRGARRNPGGLGRG